MTPSRPEAAAGGDDPVGASPLPNLMDTWGLRYGELVERRGRRAPDRPAVRYGDAVISYGDFTAGIVGIARALARLGVGPGDRVVCVSGNRPEVLQTAYACSRLGAIFVPLSAGSTRRELEYVLGDVRPALACVETGVAQAGEVFGSRGVPVLDFDRTPPASPAADGDAAAVVAAEDPAIICYTSGTTGSPKGVVLSHGALYWNSINTLLGLDIVSDDVALINTPLFHIAGLNVLTVNTLYKGGTVVLERSFDPARCLAAIQQHGVTTLFAVPTMLTLLERDPGFAAADLSTLRWILAGGAPVASRTVTAWRDRGVPVIASFGLSEAGPSVSFRRPDDVQAKPSSAGAPAILTELTVVGLGGHPVPDGQTGEIVVNGPHLASGYWNKSAETAASFRPDGLHTGDRGYVDPDGDVVIVGRATEVIITGGENVDPAEVEQAIAQHPAVLEAVVVGVPDDTWGERVAVIVVPLPGFHLELDELRTFAAASLDRYKLPRQIEIWETIPKTTVGKISRAQIRLQIRSADSSARG